MRAKTQNLSVVLVFLAGLFIPFLFTFAPAGTSHLDELRTRESFPDFPTSRRAIKDYPQRLVQYYQDHFGLRDLMIKTYNEINYRLIRRSNRVLFGADGWLFFNGDEGSDRLSSKILKDHCGQLRFTDRQLARAGKKLRSLTARYRAMGIDYWWVIVPNKHTIYSRFLPALAHCDGKQTLRTQLMRYLHADPDVNVLDLTPALQAQADAPGPYIYRKTDTHWNGRGVWRAYGEILGRLKSRHPNIRDVTRHFAGIKEIQSPGGDLARLLGLQGTLNEDWAHIHLRKYRARERPIPHYVGAYEPQRAPSLYMQPDSDAPDLLVLHDSFTSVPLKQMLSESFANTLFLWHSVTRDAPWDIVTAFTPDIVIQQFVERTLAQQIFTEFLDE